MLLSDTAARSSGYFTGEMSCLDQEIKGSGTVSGSGLRRSLRQDLTDVDWVGMIDVRTSYTEENLSMAVFSEAHVLS